MMSKQNIVLVTIENIAIVVGSYFCGFYFTGLFHEPTSFAGGLWAAISGIIVIEGMASDTLRSAKIRIIGTLTGAIISGAYLFFFSFSLLGYAVCIAAGVVDMLHFQGSTRHKVNRYYHFGYINSFYYRTGTPPLNQCRLAFR